jgi:putative transposase
MDNHVHLILLPKSGDGLRRALAESHRRYTRHVNFREGWRGHLFQARFASYPMAGAHLLAAIRYVENNPVAAGMVGRAEDWRWSSAKTHADGTRAAADPLTDLSALSLQVRNWRAMLKHGWQSADLGEQGEALADTIEARLRTGRPLGPEDWIAEVERQTGRPLAPQKRGPKPKAPTQAGASLA